MKFLVFAFLTVAGFSGFPVSAQIENPRYDAELAAALGADDYGMKSYVLVVLTTGSNTDSDQATIGKAFAGHMSNMERLVREGKLLVAGPIMKNDHNYRGIFILDVATQDEARELLETDPAIAAKFLEPLLFNWYGSAALSEYLDASDKIWKKKP